MTDALNHDVLQNLLEMAAKRGFEGRYDREEPLQTLLREAYELRQRIAHETGNHDRFHWEASHGEFKCDECGAFFHIPELEAPEPLVQYERPPLSSIGKALLAILAMTFGVGL